MIRRDHRLHIFISCALAVAGALVFGAYKGAAFALAIGAAKEVIHDWWLGLGTPEWSDMAANVAGAAAGIALVIWWRRRRR